MEGTFSRLRQLEHHIDDTIRLYENHETDDYPAHWQNAYEVILPVENEYTVLINERRYALLPGDVFIIPSGTVHEIFAPESGLRYILMIDQSQIYHIEGMAALEYCFYPCVHLSEASGPVLAEVRGYLERAIAEYTTGGALGGPAARLWLGLFFTATARHLFRMSSEGLENKSRQNSRAMAVYLDVCSYIASHCNEKLTLEDMAAYSGYSKYHFARMFKVYAGMSFYDFYMRQRVMLCERLLADDTLAITEVALRAGFGSIATFNRIFKQSEGVTPSQFRRMLRQRWICVE